LILLELGAGIHGLPSDSGVFAECMVKIFDKIAKYFHNKASVYEKLIFTNVHALV
jgi:hypothetical protein